MTFSAALTYLRNGKRVERVEWEGKNMYLMLATDWVDSENVRLFIAMKTTGGAVIPWLPSPADLLSDDWCFYHEDADE